MRLDQLVNGTVFSVDGKDKYKVLAGTDWVPKRSKSCQLARVYSGNKMGPSFHHIIGIDDGFLDRCEVEVFVRNMPEAI